MGSGPTTTKTENTQTQPWAPAVPQLQGLLGNLGQFDTAPSGAQTGAANSLVGAAQGLQNFGGQASGAASGLLGGGGANQYAGSLTGLADPSNLNPFNTPGFSDAYKTMGNDITNNVNDRFAAAGRDLSPANSTALARGLAQGQGGLIQGQYNANVGNLMGATNQLTGMNQMGNQNRLAGAGLAGMIPGLTMAPGQAQLGAANLQHNLPLSNMGAYESLLTPLAQLGSQSNGQSTTQTQTPLWQQLAGLGIAGAGMFGGGMGGMMAGLGSSGGLFGGSTFGGQDNLNAGYGYGAGFDKLGNPLQMHPPGY